MRLFELDDLYELSSEDGVFAVYGQVKPPCNCHTCSEDSEGSEQTAYLIVGDPRCSDLSGQSLLAWTPCAKVFVRHVKQEWKCIYSFSAAKRPHPTELFALPSPSDSTVPR